MSKKRQNKKTREPKQHRSIATVDAILEATRQLLSTGDLTRLTTNKISSRAGVSIGSLYQYFPNKEKILVKLSESHFEKQSNAVAELISYRGDKNLSTIIFRVVDRILQNVFSNLPLLRNLILYTPKKEYERIHRHMIDQITLTVESFLNSLDIIQDTKRSSLVVISTIDAITTQLCLTSGGGLPRETWAIEIAGMLESFLKMKQSRKV